MLLGVNLAITNSVLTIVQLTSDTAHFTLNTVFPYPTPLQLQKHHIFTPLYFNKAGFMRSCCRVRWTPMHLKDDRLINVDHLLNCN